MLRTDAAVADVAVVGLPHEDGGEEVVAAVVLLDGVTVQPDDLRAHTRQGLTPYGVPRRVVFVDELPTHPMGTVQRREVAARLRES